MRGSSAIVHDRKSSEKDLVQLVYVSSAAPALGADDLDAIAARSATNNAALGITGFLMHNGAYFYGVLEGRRRHVFTRMEEIITDRRHSTLRILREEAIATRRFENWTFSSLPAAGGGRAQRAKSHGFHLEPDAATPLTTR